jgi:hypothetical protein
MSPSAIKSTREKDNLRVWKEIAMPWVEAGSACANIKEHIAAGHSWQPLLFCWSAQQGMSVGIADIPVISATGSCFAPTGVTSGCETSPTITKIAIKRLMNRPKLIPPHRTGSLIWKGPPFHNFASDGPLRPNLFKIIKLDLLRRVAVHPQPQFSAIAKRHGKA